MSESECPACNTYVNVSLTFKQEACPNCHTELTELIDNI